MFAAQAVIAIENVRLFQELEARTREQAQSVGELRALGAVSQAVSSTLDLETVLSTIASHAVQLSGTDCGVIYEYDEREQEFDLRASHRMESEVVEILRAAPIHLGEGATGRAATMRPPVQVPDFANEREFTGARARPLLIRLGYRSLLSVPLMREQQILGPVFLNYLHLLSLALAAAGYLALMVFLRRSRWGQAIRAVSSSPEMARTVGIDLGRVHLLTYAIGSAISVPAGILVAMDVGAEPHRGTTFVLLASVGVIMGGIGSIPGALLGGVFLALLENLGVWQIPSEWQSAISFGVFLVFIVVRPRGLFGRSIQSAEI